MDSHPGVDRMWKFQKTLIYWNGKVFKIPDSIYFRMTDEITRRVIKHGSLEHPPAISSLIFPAINLQLCWFSSYFPMILPLKPPFFPASHVWWHPFGRLLAASLFSNAITRHQLDGPSPPGVCSKPIWKYNSQWIIIPNMDIYIYT